MSTGFPSGRAYGIDPQSFHKTVFPRHTHRYFQGRQVDKNINGFSTIRGSSRNDFKVGAGFHTTTVHVNLDDMNPMLKKNYLGMKIKTSHYGVENSKDYNRALQ